MHTENRRRHVGRRRLPSPPSVFGLRVRGLVRDVREARATVRPDVRPDGCEAADHPLPDGAGGDVFPGQHGFTSRGAADTESAARSCADASVLLRWGAVSCVVVPLTLLLCGLPPLTALGTALGLAAVGAVTAVLLRRSEYGYARQHPGGLTLGRPGPHRGRHGRTGTGLHRGEHYWSGPGRP